MTHTITYTDEYFLRNLEGINDVKEALYVLMSYKKHIFLESGVVYDTVLTPSSDYERMREISKRIFNSNSMIIEESYSNSNYPKYHKDIMLEFMKGNSSYVFHFFNIVAFCSLNIIPYIFQAINYHIINSTEIK